MTRRFGTLVTVVLLHAVASARTYAQPVTADVTINGGSAVSGTNRANGNDSDGVRGVAMGVGRTFGVFGVTSSQANDAAGVFGRDGTGEPASRLGSLSAGVRGESARGRGILGISENIGVQGWGTGTGYVWGVQGVTGTPAARLSAGVYGISYRTDADVFGVHGETRSRTDFAAGVRGVDGTGALTHPINMSVDAGVRGESRESIGVAGISGEKGVRGVIFSTTGAQAHGTLGCKFGTDFFGLCTVGGVRVTGWAPSSGNITATGTITGSRKDFVEPHPKDPSLVIRHSALEGPEAGAYFRGTAQTIGGEAVIDVPEVFRIVASEENLTVQLTPVKDLAILAVASQDLYRIVVRSSLEHVTFHYLVQGERRAYKGYDTITPGTEFVPPSPDARLPDHMPAEFRIRLIANGTYHPDGTVNLETAKRLGWDTLWEVREE